MRSRIVGIIFPVLAVGILHAGVSAPQLGVIRCSDGSVRAVYGLAANFILANTPFASADAISFSDRAGLMAANGTIRLVKADGAPICEYRLHEAKPVLNVDAGAASAIAWLPSEHAVLRWTGTAFHVFPIAPMDGRVTSLKADGTDRAQLLILNDDGSSSRATVTLSTGELVSLDPVPGTTGPAFAQQSILISHQRDGLAVESSNGFYSSICPFPKTWSSSGCRPSGCICRPRIQTRIGLCIWPARNWSCSFCLHCGVVRRWASEALLNSLIHLWLTGGPDTLVCHS